MGRTCLNWEVWLMKDSSGMIVDILFCKVTEDDLTEDYQEHNAEFLRKFCKWSYY